MQRKESTTNGIEVTVRADLQAEPATVGGFGEDNPLVPLRSFPGAEPLDLGFALFKSQAAMLVPLAVLLYLPIQVVDLYLRLTTSRPSSTSALTTSGIPIAILGDTSGYEYMILAAQSVALSILGIASGILTAHMATRRPVTTATVIFRSAKRIFTSVVIVAISAVVYGLSSFAPVIGWLLGGALTFMISVIAGAEEIGPIRATRRSFALAGKNMSRAAGLFLGSLILLWLTRAVLIGGPLALLFALGAPPILMEWLTNATAIILIVVQPLTATMASASYVGIRVRSEGLDLLDRIERRSGIIESRSR